MPHAIAFRRGLFAALCAGAVWPRAATACQRRHGQRPLHKKPATSASSPSASDNLSADMFLKAGLLPAGPDQARAPSRWSSTSEATTDEPTTSASRPPSPTSPANATPPGRTRSPSRSASPGGSPRPEGRRRQRRRDAPHRRRQAERQHRSLYQALQGDRRRSVRPTTRRRFADVADDITLKLGPGDRDLIVFVGFDEGRPKTKPTG